MDKNSKIVNNKIIFDDYHIHTNITDGSLFPKEIIMEAKKIGIKNIAFTEHIRKISTYDWFKFRDEVLNFKPKGINIAVGIETKVLNSEGELDASIDILESADIILGSVHGKQNVEYLLNSDCDIIAHPQITMTNIDKFLDCDKVLEINFKHQLEDNLIRKLIESRKNRFSFGSDTHKLEDLENGQRYFSDLNKRYKIRKYKI
jgi:histidinol phosphatase-like PHP family hydrolase